MAFQATAQLKGSPRRYRVHPECKAFTLRDYGFLVTKKGNFEYNQLVKAAITDQKGVYLKMAVDQDVHKLQMTVTNQMGLVALDVYHGKGMEGMAAQLDFIFKDMEEKHVLQEVTD